VLVALPASELGSGASPSTPGPRRRIEGALILLVDDEDAVRESGRRLLEARGARTVACADGESALRVLRESRTGFDAVVLDLTMPGMDGMAVLREIRALDPRLPVVLCSGYRPPSDAFPPDPYRVFASKPYDLVEVTAQALGLPRLASPDASAPDRVRASATRAAPPGSSPRA
jgi:two-component system cell cycle sensor histidine kinase/response regulator CckA